MKQRRIIRRKEVRERTGYSDTTIWRKERVGNFPRRVQLSDNAIGWYEHEINEWVASRLRGMARPVRPPAAKHEHDDDSAPQLP